MAVNSTFYLNADSLATATAVYLDFQLLNIAPDGFYGDGTIVREQVSGVLLSAESCANCPVPCSIDMIETSQLIALYTITYTVGTSTGPIIIYFRPQENPDGILVTYDGVKYNKLSCSIDGIHQSTNPLNFTFAGGDVDGCLDALPLSLSLPVYNYSSGWVNSGSIVPFTINPGDVSLSDPDFSSGATWVMVIPKTNDSPTTLEVEMISPCDDSKCNVTINCPEVLDRTVTGSIGFPDGDIQCSEEIEATYYSVRVHDDENILIGLYDYIFTDNAAENPLSDGFYLIVNDYSGTPTTEVMQIENGIVIAITPCI
jgi:hypothetical protein